MKAALITELGRPPTVGEAPDPGDEALEVLAAPLNPKAIRTNGPRQQAEARMAASPPVKSAPRPVFGSDMRLSFRIEIG